MQKTPVKNKHHNGHAKFERLVQLRDFLTDMKDSATDTTSDIITNSLQSAKNQTSHLKKNVKRYVSRKPYKSMGMAAVAGLCIGYFLRK